MSNSIEIELPSQDIEDIKGLLGVGMMLVRRTVRTRGDVHWHSHLRLLGLRLIHVVTSTLPLL